MFKSHNTRASFRIFVPMNKLYFGDNLNILRDNTRGLLGGTERPDYPDASFGALTHKIAQVDKKRCGQEGMF